MKRKPYPTDLTDEQWAIIEPLIPPCKPAGRKRTLIVDTLGLLLDLWVHPADIQDYDAGKEVLEPLRACYPRMKKVWADGQFGKNGLPEWAQAEAGIELEIVKRAEGTKGFVVQVKRWIVERTLGWLN